METLRLAGFVFGMTGLVLAAFGRFRWHRLANGDWLLANAFALALLLAGVVPDAFNAVLRAFSFRKGGGGGLSGYSSFLILRWFI